MIHIDFKTKNQMAGSAPISMRIIYHTSLERVGESRTGYRREGQGGMQVDCCFQSQLHSVFRSTLLFVGRGRERRRNARRNHLLIRTESFWGEAILFFLFCRIF